MTKTNCTWEHPYAYPEAYSKRVAYFSMEYGLDAAMKIYSGGLGYLAGSHMRSAYELKQNMIGIGMLWKFGYYEQIRDQKSQMRVLYRERYYTFLEPTDLIFPININGNPVQVQAWYLPPGIFETIPMYFLTTDIEGANDYLSRTITHRLYDANAATRIAQSIVLGIGGAKVVEALGGADYYHMNEAHALPLAFYLYSQLKDAEKVKSKVVFTTHTPEKAGNEERDIHLLDKMGFFSGVPLADVRKITDHNTGSVFGYTPGALALCCRSNGVSQLHADVSNDMWAHLKNKPEIIGITNAQNQRFWQDIKLKKALDNDDDKALSERKRELKVLLFKIVADQTGKLFDPDVLTIVWARRFAGYKRADLIMRNPQYFYEMLSRAKYPMQIIWAGKPYPEDDYGVDVFNRLVEYTHLAHNATILTGYEMNLSAALKKGADIWLNTPRRPREASGTSGMTAAMNGAVNVSINDGWVPEFAQHGHNAFVIPEADEHAPTEVQDQHDYEHLMRIMETEVVPTYYDKPSEWWKIVKNGMREVVPQFESGRMADEYYKRLFL
ncbi:MAG: alpha-glucan family phosphorylase [Bacteroidetes bacterium]|nr:MAG: alpha-glucan family phosphorylase [Bacteroidota bacterium]